MVAGKEGYEYWIGNGDFSDTSQGRVLVYAFPGGSPENEKKIREYFTRQSLGVCVPRRKPGNEKKLGNEKKFNKHRVGVHGL